MSLIFKLIITDVLVLIVSLMGIHVDEPEWVSAVFSLLAMLSGFALFVLVLVWAWGS